MMKLVCRGRGLIVLLEAGKRKPQNLCEFLQCEDDQKVKTICIYNNVDNDQLHLC